MSTLLGRYVGTDFIGRYTKVWFLHFLMWTGGWCLLSASAALLLSGAGTIRAVVPLLIGYVLILTIAWYSRTRSVRLTTNPLPVSADSLRTATDEYTYRHVRYDDLPKNQVEWCDTLIRKRLNRVIGKNVHIPQTSPQVIQVNTGALPNYMNTPLLHRALFGRVLYFPSLDTVVVGVNKDEDATLYLTLIGSLMRITYDESVLRYLAAALTYCSNSPRAFLYAREMLVRHKAALSYWPKYLSEPGWHKSQEVLS